MTREEAREVLIREKTYLNGGPDVNIHEYEEALGIAIEALRQMPCEKNDPLTLEELRQMNGEPVWIEGEETWGIVAVDGFGPWADKPFAVFRYKSVTCTYDIERRGLKCYRRKPEVK